MPNCLKGDLEQGQNLTVTEIQQKIDLYHDYMLAKVPLGQKVYLSNVFEKADLQMILSDTCDGIRVMLVKENDSQVGSDEQARISLIVVPVKKVEVSTDAGNAGIPNFRFENMLTDADKVIYVECPSKYCDSSTSKPILP